MNEGVRMQDMREHLKGLKSLYESGFEAGWNDALWQIAMMVEVDTTPGDVIRMARELRTK